MPIRDSLFFFLFLFVSALAVTNEDAYAFQTKKTMNSGQNTPAPSDSLAIVDSVVSDTNARFMRMEDMMAKEPPPKKEYQMTKSTWGAVWRSLVLPGWGQLYVESYWKAPLFTAAAGTCVFFIIDNHVKYIDKRDEHERLKAEDPRNTRLSIVRNEREFYRDNRDMAAFYLLGVYIISAVDAYVGAHLYDFNVSDDVSMSIMAVPMPSLSFRVSF